MRYPIGRGTQKDFDKYWYIASKFGEFRNTYYHSGDDYNLKTGGDTDLGQPLYAVEDGEIVSTDKTSTTGFGKQIYLKFYVNNKMYYAGYDHCQSIVVESGDRVKEGDILGYLGKSGTASSHLHFVIKNKANGMDNVPNTLEELKEWENPTEFIKKYIGGLVPPEQETMPTELETYLGFDKFGETEKEKLKMHLGEKDGKCDWGNADGDRGGDLGSARRKITVLEKQIEVGASNPPKEDEPEWVLNGKTEEEVIGGKKIIKNYAVRG